jgi:predicted membrane chloride channel (bestrophin family)
LAIFSWTLKHFLRGTQTNGSDEDIIRTMLPSDADVEYIMMQRKKPVAIVMRLRQALAHCSHKHMLTTAEEMAFDHCISAMDQSIMLTERIIASPIPPLFTSHAGRLIVFYLGFLPVALKSGGSMGTVSLMLTMAAVGYAMLGLDELSHIMEQPFKKSPLYQLCKNSMRDVIDAFVLRPPALEGGHRSKGLKPPQPYWDEADEFEPFSPEMKGESN